MTDEDRTEQEERAEPALEEDLELPAEEAEDVKGGDPGSTQPKPWTGGLDSHDQP